MTHPIDWSLDDYFFLLATSPDTRFTFAGKVQLQSRDGQISLVAFDAGSAIREWTWSERFGTHLATWSVDSSRFALYRPPDIHIFDLRSGEEFVLNAGKQVIGLYFDSSDELLTQYSDHVRSYSIRRPIPPPRVTRISNFASCGRHFVYCDRDGMWHFSRRNSSEHFPLGRTSTGVIADALAAAPLRRLRLSPCGDWAYLAMWSSLRSARARVVSFRSDGWEDASWSEVDLPLRSADSRWAASEGNSILLLSPGPSGFQLARRTLPRGNVTVLGHLDARHITFSHGVDGSQYVIADTDQTTRVLRVDDSCLVELMSTSADVGALQISRERICSMVSADDRCRCWNLTIDGKPVTELARRSLAPDRELSAPPARRAASHPGSAAIIYVPSLLDRNRTWAQSPFFQHVLFGITRMAQRDGCTFVALSSLRGLPRDRRALVNALGQQLEETLRALHAQGCRRVGIVGGSIAGYAILRNMAVVNQASALMLLSPVHHMSAQIAERFGYESDKVGGMEADLISRAAAVSVPTAIVHGLSDELSPSACSSNFMSHLPELTPKRYVPILDEGHVFQQFRSWQRLVDCFIGFSHEHLKMGIR